MKKLFPLLVIALMLGFAYTATARNSAIDKPLLNAIYSLEVSADAITHNALTKAAIYSKNVSLQTEHLKLENAGKVVFDLKTNKFTIYDCKKFVFEGNCVVKDNATKTNTIEYTFGDDTLYLPVRVLSDPPIRVFAQWLAQ